MKKYRLTLLALATIATQVVALVSVLAPGSRVHPSITFAPLLLALLLNIAMEQDRRRRRREDFQLREEFRLGDLAQVRKMLRRADMLLELPPRRHQNDGRPHFYMLPCLGGESKGFFVAPCGAVVAKPFCSKTKALRALRHAVREIGWLLSDFEADLRLEIANSNLPE